MDYLTKKKKKTDDSKFYGYTGPVKPEKDSWITKKSEMKSYGKTKISKQIKEKKSSWITKKKKNK